MLGLERALEIDTQVGKRAKRLEQFRVLQLTLNLQTEIVFPPAEKARPSLP